jgi:hypothetical protein
MYAQFAFYAIKLVENNEQSWMRRERGVRRSLAPPSRSSRRKLQTSLDARKSAEAERAELSAHKRKARLETGDGPREEIETEEKSLARGVRPSDRERAPCRFACPTRQQRIENSPPKTDAAMSH